MTTPGQRACYVIDHLVEALGNEPSSHLRRALILNDIDRYPGTTQTGVMERLGINKSNLTREIDWLFNYGCIIRQDCDRDARAKRLQVCGYSKKALDAALDYFDGEHENLKIFIEGLIRMINQDKPSLRDAKIIYTLYEKKKATKQQVIDSLYNASPSTHHRAYNKLKEQGVIEDAG